MRTMLGTLALVAATLTGCSSSSTSDAQPKQSPEELAETLAQIDQIRITVGDFQDRINKQSPYIRARYTSPERKKEFLDNLIRFEVLAKEAAKRGFDKDPEVQRTMKQVMIQKLMKEEFETRVKPEDITDAEMQQFYKDHNDEYNKPEQVRASAIVIADAARAKKVAEQARATGADNKAFRDLVTQYSQDEDSKARGGDLRYFGKDSTDVPKEILEPTFAVQTIGDVIGPIRTAKGFYIIKVTGRRKAITRSFEEVKKQIQNRLYRDKRTKAMEDFVASLRGKAHVQVFDDKLAKVIVDTSQPAGPMGGAFPGAPGGGMPMAPGMAPHGAGPMPMGAPRPMVRPAGAVLAPGKLPGAAPAHRAPAPTPPATTP